MARIARAFCCLVVVLWLAASEDVVVPLACSGQYFCVFVN